jgi:hypothetical protein
MKISPYVKKVKINIPTTRNAESVIIVMETPTIAAVFEPWIK